MTSYWKLRRISPLAERRRVIANLEQLRQQLADELPQKTTKDTLILGTWNIRNFDDNRFGQGPRREESMWYITEIISTFDILAIQEICDDLRPLDKVMSNLDYAYDYIITDVTEGPGGNKERLGFIYNSNKVRFKGVAGEIVLPYKDLVSDVTKQRQFSRTPFSCSFQSGWFKFMFSTVHIYFGKPSPKSPEYRRRVEEIRKVSKFLSKRADKDQYNHILVGDFNIEDLEGETFNALTEFGFDAVENKKGSNHDQTKFYDQISFKPREDEVQFANDADPDKSHGVFNFFERLFTPAQMKDYEPFMKANLSKKIEKAETGLAKAKQKKDAAVTAEAIQKQQKAIEKHEKSIVRFKESRDTKKGLEDFYRIWRTFQLSDHLPLWVELEIDFSEDYLKKLKA